MNTQLIEDIAAAVLYEGYLLYPYRASAVKNRQRWNFGVLYPRAYAEAQSGADAWSMQTECLLRAAPDASVQVRVRFLHLIAQTVKGEPWQRAMEREIAVPVPLSGPSTMIRREEIAPIEDQQAIEVTVEVEVAHCADGLAKIRVNTRNTTASGAATRDEALMCSLVSTHAILSVDQGEFISLLEPPDELADLAAACQNIGAWPVLVGEEGARDAMLASPIILYDYPQIAPESPGALFDGTEIDEILTLRILTLTDEEKAAMGQADERTREILERTEAMAPEQFMRMHGILRGVRDAGGDPQPEAL